MPSEFTSKLFSYSPTPERNKLYYGWIVLLSCFIIAIVGAGIHLSFGVFFKSLEADFGLTRASTSGIFSTFLLFGMIFSIIGGWALDRYGPRIILTLMGLFSGLGLLSTSQANVLWHLYISHGFLLAMGSAYWFPILASVASMWFVKKRGLALGIVTSGISGSMIIMAPVSTYLILNYGWRMSYIILALTGLFLIIPFAQLLKRTLGEAATLSEKELQDIINLNPADRQACGDSGSFSLLQAVKTGNFWVLFSLWFLIGNIFYIFTTHIVPHAIDLGIIPTIAASILSLFSVAAIAGSLLMGKISDTIGHRKSIVICSLLIVGAMLWLVWTSNIWMMFLFAVFFGFGSGGFIVPLTALAGDTFGLNHLGKIMTALNAGWMIGGAIGPVFVGYIFDISGSYTIGFLVGALAALSSTALALLFKTSDR